LIFPGVAYIQTFLISAVFSGVIWEMGMALFL